VIATDATPVAVEAATAVRGYPTPTVGRTPTMTAPADETDPMTAKTTSPATPSIVDRFNASRISDPFGCDSNDELPIPNRYRRVDDPGPAGAPDAPSLRPARSGRTTN
jgi:hypothetical protein